MISTNQFLNPSYFSACHVYLIFIEVVSGIQINYKKKLSGLRAKKILFWKEWD
jgi:hypothetical protein